jgi:hypothetical protein
VPVQEKFVKVAIPKTTWPRVVCARTILNVLNAIERVFVFVELNIPVVKLPPNVNVPAVNVYVPVAVNAYVLLNVTLPDVCVNVATELNTDVPVCVYEPEVITKLTEGVIVP